MNWSPAEWEKSITRLVDQCADKVMLELEEVILARLREAGENVLEDLFKHLPFTNTPQVSSEDDLSLSRHDPLALVGEELWYAFGIVNVNQGSNINLLGMEDRPCRIIEKGNLGMLVCPVPRQDYTEESLHCLMEDLVWVENHARRHEEILLKVMEVRAVIPLPFCTIFTNEENIKRQLTHNAETLQSDLQRLGDHSEMYVKLFVNRQRLLEKLQEDLPYTGEQSGGGYFQKRQWEKKIKEEMERLMDDYGESLYQDLNSISADTNLLDKGVILVPEGMNVVFASHFLLAKECHEEWDRMLKEFDEIADPLGFVLDVSGPWPPYHFSRLDHEEETMSG